MPRLCVQAHVVAVRAGHIHVEVLEQRRHLADQDVPAPLRLNEVEGPREAPVAPPCERGHPGRISRITTASTATRTSRTTARRAREARSAVRCCPRAACAVRAASK